MPRAKQPHDTAPSTAEQKRDIRLTPDNVCVRLFH